MATKKLQAKLFGTPEQGSSPAPGQSIDPNLKINIPNPPTLSELNDSGRDGRTNRSNPDGDTTRWDPSSGQSHRQFLLNKLGTRYDGVERYRLEQDERRERHWKRWGPYLSERQWATVREDYSANGDAWAHFPHDHARSRAYRWGEDGLAGISDNHQRICFALALWNGQDEILKERLFGVTGHQGNHGEDVKEQYYYLDSTPTHSYMKFLYKYPQRKYPYQELVDKNKDRGRDVVEYEILDTDIFEDDRYWDIFVEYAKDPDGPDSMSIRVSAFNRGPEPATIHIMPNVWFRNTWSWDPKHSQKPNLRQCDPGTVQLDHPELQTFHFYASPSPPPATAAGEMEGDAFVEPQLLFTENETNYERIWGGQNASPFAKDAFHDHLIPSHRSVREIKTPTKETLPESPPIPVGPFVNPDQTGTKAAAHYRFENVPPNGGCVVMRMKLTPSKPQDDITLRDDEAFDTNMEAMREDADEFYKRVGQGPISDDLRSVMRQALAGMMWSKQYYQFIQMEWINGDPGQPPPPPERKWIRNREWKHLYIADILSMPDKWEYPFFAAWDTAFHCIPLTMIDPAFSKKQLELLTREWYMKPDGQIPAYEWNFSDVNPPVHAWAAFRIFKMERKMWGNEDLQFLERVFQKLLLNFTWWINRKDTGGNNVFEGGFLGLDNIGVFNRSEPLPTGGVLRQADGTAWMAFFALNMLNIALELAKHNPVYEDIASKFFEHFIFISDAMTYRGRGDNELSLWNDEDGMYYDAIQFGPGHSIQLPIHSLVGLIPLYATLTLEPSVINRFPGFRKRMEWFIENRPEMSARNLANMKIRGKGDRRLLALVSKDKLVRILERMLDEDEFFSDHGIRSLSFYHKDHPYQMEVNGQHYEVGYWPGDSRSGMFGGNSNWRGPVWLAVNFLLIESLQRFHQFYGDELQVECPTGSGEYMNLAQVGEEIQHRIIHLFARDVEGRRATNGGHHKLDLDPHFRDYVLFHEFFHGNDGRGLGASHQTGWTGLVAYHIMQTGMTCRLPRTPRTPRSQAHHYFDEQIDSRSEYAEDGGQTPFSRYSELKTAEDLSPEAL